jgi:hypothetical protein
MGEAPCGATTNGGPVSTGTYASVGIIPASRSVLVPHVWSGLHADPIGQSSATLHSTQICAAVSHTKPIPEHARSDVHAVGGATHASSRQTCPSRQSTSPMQSTQYPRAVSQTCPGHERLDVHAITSTHAFARHTWLDPQSVGATHCTHVECTKSQTMPAPLH